MKYKVTLNGKTYEVEVEKGEAIVVDEYAAYAPKAPIETAPVSVPTAPAATAAAPKAGNGKAVLAPLPGTVVNIKANVGATVKKGETVIVIEAMKMENEITAPVDGKVVGIFVQKGATIAQGAPLFELA